MKMFKIKQTGKVVPQSAFVGTMFGGGITSMGCLLEDGTFLTTLHSIYDLENGTGYYPLDQMKVYFVKNGYLYRYKVDGIIHDGNGALNAYGGQALTFDYAKLRLSGEPLQELGGGLALDTFNYFGTPYESKPSETFVLTGPTFFKDTQGILCCKQEFDASQSYDDGDNTYSFSHTATYRSHPGTSGLAIIRLDDNNNSVLYAVHRGCERFQSYKRAFIVSEYLSTVATLPPYQPNLDVKKKYSYVYDIEWEANKYSEQRQQLADAHKATAIGNSATDERMKKFQDEAYDLRDTRELAAHFPALGNSIFSSSNVIHTDTKTYFNNPGSGWSVKHDRHGQYNTVQNDKGHYVDWNGNTDPHGKGSQYHFYNKQPAPGAQGPKCNIPIDSAKFKKKK